MRLLFISQLFDPEYSIKGHSLMKRLTDDGYEVEVLTTFPNYPTGKVFPGYSIKFKQVDVIEGVKVTRLWSYISHSNSKLSRAISYISFTILALCFAVFGRKPDLIYAYHPQFTTGFIGLFMLLIRRTPYITDVQDLWPDALNATGMRKGGAALSFINFWCKVIYKYASRVVVLSNGYKKTLVDRGVAENKIDVVYNWCPEESQINKILKSKKDLNKIKYPAKFVYAGNIGSAQSLKALIMALGTNQKSDLTLSFIGDGLEKESLVKYVNDRGFSNVFFEEFVPASKIFNLLSDADVLVIHLKKDSLFKITIPSKTQSSMAMGKPLLMVVGGEANKIVIDANAGEVAEPGNLDEISNAAKNLLARREIWPQLGSNAKKFYESNFSMEVNYHKLRNVIDRAAM